MALAGRLGPDRAVLAGRTDLVAPYIASIVRNGLNMMPPFRTTEISDAELEALAAYVAGAAKPGGP
jgi:mono/diheme cytochrome c family protein